MVESLKALEQCDSINLRELPSGTTQCVKPRESRQVKKKMQVCVLLLLTIWSLCETHSFTCRHAYVLVWLVDQSTCGLVP